MESRLTDVVRLAALLLDLVEDGLERRPVRDVKPGGDEADVGAHEPVELDVAHLAVDSVLLLSRNPVLLHGHALEPGRDGDRADRARVVGLDSAD